MSTNSEPIVHKQPAVQSNPFQKSAADHLSAGTVAIESERAVAEAQGKLVIAKRFPRNQALAYANIIDACRRPGLAEEACYSFPRGGEVISGPAIRLAEMLAANWGNVDYGIRELSRKDGVSEMEAYCWDLETNTMSSQKFTVRHVRDTKHGQKALTDERDIYELTANLGARRLRARILAILPADLVQAAVDQCTKTLASGGETPIADRIRAMVIAFKALSVPVALIEKRLGHSVDQCTGEELADLRKIHNSLRDNMSALGDWFGDGPKTEDAPAEQERAPAPEKKSRAPKGAQTVTQAAAPAVEVQATPVAAAEPAPQAPAPEPAKPAAEPPKAATPAPEAPKAAPVVQGPRTKLEDGEVIVVQAKIKKADGILINFQGAPTPSVSAQIGGSDYEGTVFHIGGGERKGDAIVPAGAWNGTAAKITLRGKKNKIGGNMMTVVDAIEAVAETVSVE